MTGHAAIGYAPGKIILFGEHAVVYGQPALAASIDRGVRVVTAKRDPQDLASNRLGPVLTSAGIGLLSTVRPAASGNPSSTGEGPEVLRLALEKLVSLCGERVRDLHFSVEGNIPIGSGLGSSAAMSVALVRGVHRYFEEELSDSDAARLAYEMERIFHGNPSGVDHTTIAHGGVLLFRRLDAETLTTHIEPLYPKRRTTLVVGMAGPHAGTARAVSALRERAKRHPDLYTHIYRGIGSIAQEGAKLLEQGHLAALGELMDVNQGFLNALGVSTPAIESMCSNARSAGALGAKLTGAGGGGAVLALVDGDPAPVLQAMSVHAPAFLVELHPPVMA